MEHTHIIVFLSVTHLMIQPT